MALHYDSHSVWLPSIYFLDLVLPRRASFRLKAWLTTTVVLHAFTLCFIIDHIKKHHFLKLSLTRNLLLLSICDLVLFHGLSTEFFFICVTSKLSFWWFCILFNIIFFFYFKSIAGNMIGARINLHRILTRLWWWFPACSCILKVPFNQFLIHLIHSKLFYTTVVSLSRCCEVRHQML